jgi:CHAD domain-containing protein
MRENNSSALGGLMADQWGRYRKALKRSKAVMSEQSTHDLRVSLRKLQAGVDLVGLFLPASHTAKTRRDIKRLRRALGPIRDLQVQILAAGELANAHPDLLKFQRRLSKKEYELIRESKRRIKTRHARLNRHFSATLERSHDLLRMFTAFEIERTVSGAIDKSCEEVAGMKRAVDRRDTSAIHRLRTAFKKFRYVMETAQPLLKDIPDARLERMRDMQRMMGEIHDAEVLYDAVARWGAKRKRKIRTGLSPVYELLAQRRRDSIDTFLARIEELHTYWKPSEVGKKRLAAAIRLIQ